MVWCFHCVVCGDALLRALSPPLRLAANSWWFMSREAERIRHAESLGGLGRGGVHRGQRAQVIGFSSHDDYEEWNQVQRVRAPGR